MPDAHPTVGFVGIGRMGLPMSRNLLAAGFPLVAYNRTPSRAEPLVADGARLATSVGELAAAVDIVVVCLDRVEASEEIFLGPGGVLARARPGTLAIDHGTIGPDTARAIAGRLAARNIGFLDAPVSGGPEGAAKATLAIMAGGRAADFERALPLFRACGSAIGRMGEVGAGSLAKLVNQLLTFVHAAVAAEAIGLAERTGLDLSELSRLLGAGFAQSRMLERTLGRVLAGDFEAGAPLRLYAKDMGLLDELGRATGASLPLFRTADELLDRARAAGLAERDVAALVLLFRNPPARPGA
jgi:3-hydroxyisobutyrate dehydrogenase-like beta-hydroxyacid dehydrogenase